MSQVDTPALSDRLRAIRADVMSRGGSFLRQWDPFARDVALYRARRAARSRVQVRAGLLYEAVALAPIEIGPHWRLAGEHLMARPHWPQFAFRDENTDPADLARAWNMDLDEARKVQFAVREWCCRHRMLEDGGSWAVGEFSPDAPRPAGHLAGEAAVYDARGFMENHSVRDYARVLREGFAGIAADVQRRLDKADLADPEFPRKENFWRAALSVCEAGILLGKRYADRAAELADTAESHAERQRLEQIAECCSRVPAGPAATLFEAAQSLWLAHVLTCGEDGINANSIGRLDQILRPYYDADLAAGRLTREQAVEIMAELACKLYLEYDVQAIVLGGQDREGRDAECEMTHIILEATRRVDFIRDLSVRLHAGSSDRLLAHAAEMIVRGGGIPFLFNDECFVPALAERGIALADARDYAPIGCIELTIPGKANPHAVSGWFSAAKCLELALFDGCDPRSAQQMGPRTGLLSDHASFESLWHAYQSQVDHFARRMVYHCNRGELYQRELGPLPVWSVLTDDCIARGRDITDGGAIYNYHSICLMGAANTADSLMAVRRLVFEKRTVAADELLDALRTDFADREPLRQMLLHEAPKYGNDDAEVDALAADVCNDFIDRMDAARSPLNGRYVVHLFSFLRNLDYGRGLGATPDGRKAGEPLAYSLSAQQGRDREGVTALLRSIARCPHSRAAGASAAIIEVDPEMLAGPAGTQRMVQLIRTAMAMGVGQLQWNVTTAERLVQAQQDPERYGNLAVRVAGYSQLFRLVDKPLQDHIIARTKHRR